MGTMIDSNQTAGSNSFAGRPPASEVPAAFVPHTDPAGAHPDEVRFTPTLPASSGAFPEVAAAVTAVDPQDAGAGPTPPGQASASAPVLGGAGVVSDEMADMMAEAYANYVGTEHRALRNAYRPSRPEAAGTEVPAPVDAYLSDDEILNSVLGRLRDFFGRLAWMLRSAARRAPLGQ